MARILNVMLRITARYTCTDLSRDTAEEKAAFRDPQTLYAYRRKMESASNGIFKNLVFDETVPEVKKALWVFNIPYQDLFS